MSRHILKHVKNLEYYNRLNWNFYDPQYPSVYEKINGFKVKQLDEFISQSVRSGSTPREDKREPLNDGTDVLFIKTDSVRKGFINYDVADLLPLKEHYKRKNTALKNYDIIVTIVGATHDIVARSGVYLHGGPANINQSNALIRLKDPHTAGFISTFINSKYGRSQLWRYSGQTSQVTLNTDEVSQLQIPLLPHDIVTRIHNCVLESEKLRTDALKLYKTAESLLLQEVKLEKLVADQTLIQSYNDVVKAKRMNPEYFNPVYDRLFDVLSQYPHKTKPLSSIVKISKGCEVGTTEYVESGKDFVRIGDFTIFGVQESDRKISNELFSQLKRHFQPQVGDILFTKDGTIGLSYVLKDKMDVILSSGFLRLKLADSEFDRECLALILNSYICELQVRRVVSGAVIPHLKPNEFLKFKIPLIPKSVQKSLSDLLLDAYDRNKKSTKLLAEGKNILESVIESNFSNKY